MSSDTQVRPPPASVPFGEALRFWLKLGFISFGGPAAQIAIMHFELVERRRWISERRFLHALNYCMLLPGPEAQQLATYLGWLMHRTWGGIAAGVLFVLPSLVILIALAWLYMAMGQHPWVVGVFAGLKPAVVALVLHAAWRIGTRVLHNLWTWSLAITALLAMAVFDAPFPLVIAAAAVVGVIGSRLDPAAFGPPKPQVDEPGHASRPPAVIDDDTPSPPHARHSRGGLATVLMVGLASWGAVMGALVVWQGTDSLLVQMGRFFTQAALLTFGGAYAVLPYVYQGAVEHHQWVTAAQMMDGLALGETTPGPLIMVVAFVAFVGAWTQPVLGADTALASAVLAAVLVTFFTFLPSFVFILAGGPLVEATHGRLGFTGPLTAITAAVVGVIVKLGLFFAGHVFWPQVTGGPIDVGAVVITAAALVALFRFRVGVIPLLAACAAVGVVGSWI